MLFRSRLAVVVFWCRRLCSGHAKMCHEHGRRYPARDVQRTFGFSDGTCPFVGINAGESQRLAPVSADVAFVDWRMNAVQGKARLGKPLLQVRDSRCVVIVEMRPCREKLDRVEAVGGDFEEMLTTQSLAVVEVCRHPKLSFHHFAETALVSQFLDVFGQHVPEP